MARLAFRGACGAEFQRTRLRQDERIYHCSDVLSGCLRPNGIAEC